ncbi:MAG: ThiF family adenylyltransferase [Gemmatimonadales bacterium]|nr:ThiF family adenylyltransferase [Gemmatimonadales bacterium]MDZ4389924.1 ThiF family adenylyltransferase [Gemmatimonadales bacterium]
MFQRLVSRNEDLGRLVDKGYAVSFRNNCLVVSDVPYLNRSGELEVGAIVAKLVFVDESLVRQDDHQVLFAGGVPHGLDRKPIPNLGGGEVQFPMGPSAPDVVVQRSFSNKPIPGGAFPDFFEKIESYVGIIAGPAMERYGRSALTHRSEPELEDQTVFRVRDAMSSRAGITDLASLFADEVVAIIGLGGTGSYLLDFLVRTPVRAIRGFDGDTFALHNAFRSPGRIDTSEFGQSKAAVLQSRYEQLHGDLRLSCKVIDDSAAAELDGVTFAFVCVDHGPSRGSILRLLETLGIPCIDVGLGLKRGPTGITGMIRTTRFGKDGASLARTPGLAEVSERPEGLYDANIQIGELNALNAALAVIQYKQARGFYGASEQAFHYLFGVDDLKVVGYNGD